MCAIHIFSNHKILKLFSRLWHLRPNVILIIPLLLLTTFGRLLLSPPFSLLALILLCIFIIIVVIIIVDDNVVCDTTFLVIKYPPKCFVQFLKELLNPLSVVNAEVAISLRARILNYLVTFKMNLIG